VSDRIERARRAKFNFGRFIVESLVSGAVGSGVAYGTYSATCGNTPCLGGALGALGLDIAVTPLVAWGAGELMGGDGSLGTTYLLGLAAFAGGGAGATSDDAVLALAIGMILEPFTASLGYEISSHMKAVSVLGPNGWIRPRITPLLGSGDSLRGAALTVGGGF
jgi:hypothetical protein